MKNNKVVFIITDTTRWDMLSCARETGLSTPNLDRLASEGIRFDKAYTAQPLCQPARSAIFSGMYPHSCGGWTNSVAIGDNVHTIGERLEDKGVHTAYVGKWHLDGSDYFGLGEAPKGWDKNYWYDQRNYLEELTDEERTLSRKIASMEDHDYDEDFMFGHRCSNKAIDFLEKHNTEDFFLVVSYDEPHYPCLCPTKYHEKYKDFEFPKDPNVYDTLENKPDFQKYWAGEFLDADKEALKIGDKYYFGCNEFIDYEIGRVLEAVDKYAEDAVVIYTSDHGTMMFNHSLTLKGPAGYDEITKVPFIIRGKDIAKNVVKDSLISHVDIAPTLFDLFGFEIPVSYVGKSLLPILEGKTDKINEEIFFEFGRYECNQDYFGGFQLMRAVFDGKYKLMINLLDTDELYNLEADPYEMNNLINDESSIQIRNSLHQKILDMMGATRDPFRGYVWERRPWRTDITEDPKWREGYIRQREEEYEPRQIEYATGLPMKDPVRYGKTTYLYS